jgi:hypothetical protein
MCILLPLLDNSSVNTSQLQTLQPAMEELLDAAYSMRSVYYEGFCGLVSLLGNDSVNEFPRPRIIVEGVVFYTVHVMKAGCYSFPDIHIM